jgi:Flp pilus assembly protein TadD
MLAKDFMLFARCAMNRFLAGTATIALCAFWASGCASTGAGDDAPAKTAAAKPAADQPAKPDAELAGIENTLPNDIPGEIARAHALREHGAYEEAAKSLAQIMLVAPDNAQVIGEYGKTLVQQGRAREAVAFLKRAAQISPNDWTIYSAMGVALDQAGDHADAKLAYNHALSLKPGEPSVLNNLAVSRALAGDVSGAQTILAKATATGGDQPKIANNLAAIDAMRKPVTPAPVSKPATQKPVTMAAQSPAPIITALPPVTAAATNTHASMAPKTLAPTALVPVQAPSQKLASTNTTATAADEKKLGPGVVMQAIPVDPFAGPIHAQSKTADAKPTKKPVAKAAETTKLAAAVKPAVKVPAVKVDAPPPVLRTASDAN